MLLNYTWRLVRLYFTQVQISLMGEEHSVILLKNLHFHQNIGPGISISVEILQVYFEGLLKYILMKKAEAVRVLASW